MASASCDFAKQLGTLSDNVFSSAAWSGNPNEPATTAFYKKFKDKYGFLPQEHEVEGYSAIYIIADALKRAKLTGDLAADREAVRQAAAEYRYDDGVRQGEIRRLGLARSATNTPTRTSTRRDHSVLAQWRDGELLNVWPKAERGDGDIFPDNTTTR